VAPEAVVFDLDGTVWDSYPWYGQVLEDEAGVPRDQVVAELFHGASIVRLITQHGVSRSRFVRRAVSSIDSPPLYPGIRHTLSALQGRRIPLAVFTSLPGSIAEPKLNATGLRDCFSAVVHAGNCRVRKPPPKGIFQALDAMNLTPTQAVGGPYSCPNFPSAQAPIPSICASETSLLSPSPKVCL
jgi:phosphoglycolate phosphatase